MDDVLVHSKDNEKRLDLRSGMFEAFCEVFKKQYNPKFWDDGVRPAAQKDIVAAGIYMNKEGMQVSDHAIDAVEYALQEHAQTSLNEMLHAKGCFGYCRSAFALDLDDRTKVGELAAIAFSHNPDQTTWKQKP